MSKVDEAKNILKLLGMPSKQQNDIAAYTLLALCGINESDSWTNVKRKSLTISKDIMSFVNKAYKKDYAPNTRETFRRQALHQFVQAGLVEYNPDNPALATNSNKNHYALSNDFVILIRQYGTDKWDTSLTRFLKKKPALSSIYDPRRQKHIHNIEISDGEILLLSPGSHNKLQLLFIQKFLPIFTPVYKLLYLGDTANKAGFIDNETLADLNIQISDREKLPDIIIYDLKNKWIYLIEAVTSHGPVSPKRKMELNDLFGSNRQNLVYITIFLDFKTYKKYANEIAWETEIWIAEMPEHLIHYNGDKFLGPRK